MNVATAYDRWADSYDSDPNRTRDLAATVLQQQRFPPADRRTLEIGCGTGRNTPWLAAHSRAVVGADLSWGMLRHAAARIRSPRVHFVRHDLSAGWPFADASLDLVAAVLVLEHIETLAPVFDEAARTLRAGGCIFLCELHPMRQIAGRQAVFRDPASDALIRVPAYLHDTSDYVNAGLRAGLQLTHMGDWRDPGAGAQDLPRLVSMWFRRPDAPAAR